MYGRHLAGFMALICAVLIAPARAADPYDHPDVAVSMIRVYGSGTMAGKVKKWAGDFMSANPGVRIEVSGEGTTSGFRALICKYGDIWMASREPSKLELKAVDQRGIILKSKRIAWDTVSVFTDPSFPVNSLSLENLRKIYEGSITNWREAGGPDMPVKAFAPGPKHGTSVWIRKNILEGGGFGPDVVLTASTPEMLIGKSPHEGAVGILGGLELKHMSQTIERSYKTLSIHPNGQRFRRPLWFLWNDRYVTQHLQKFVDFCTERSEKDETAKNIGRVEGRSKNVAYRGNPGFPDVRPVSAPGRPACNMPLS